jgi:hypothetical protein
MSAWTTENKHELKRGVCFYENQGNAWYKCHVVDIIEDELKNPQIVYRWYGKHKQWWHWCIESMGSFNMIYGIKYSMEKPNENS